MDDPNNAEHRKLFDINKDQIDKAFESLGDKDQDKEAFFKLIEVYTNGQPIA